VELVKKQLTCPVHRVTRGKRSDELLVIHQRKDGFGSWVYSGIPTYNINPDGSDGHVPRQCTWNFKVEPLDKATRWIIGVETMKKWRKKHSSALRSIREHEKKMRTTGCLGPGRSEERDECWQDALVQQWIGISLDESYRAKSPRHLWQSFRYPLIDLYMRRRDCLAWMRRNKYPEPPRSACVYCPYHSDAEWRNLRDNEPDAFAKAVQVEKEYQKLKALSGQKGVPFLHNSRVPLDQVDFSTDEDHGQQVMFGNECEGMCGV
jgi:hypothetical protein